MSQSAGQGPSAGRARTRPPSLSRAHSAGQAGASVTAPRDPSGRPGSAVEAVRQGTCAARSRRVCGPQQTNPMRRTNVTKTGSVPADFTCRPPAIRHNDPETRHRHDPESPRTKPEAEGSSWPRNATEPRGGPGPPRVLEHLPCCLQGDGGLPGGPRAPDPLLRHGDPAEATSCPRQSLAPHPGRRPRGSHLSVSSPFALSPVVSLSELRRPQAPREYSGLGHPQVFPGLSQCLD